MIQQERSVVYVIYEIVKAGCEQLVGRDIADQYVFESVIRPVATSGEYVRNAVGQIVPFEVVQTRSVVEVTSHDYERRWFRAT